MIHQPRHEVARDLGPRRVADAGGRSPRRRRSPCRGGRRCPVRRRSPGNPAPRRERPFSRARPTGHPQRVRASRWRSRTRSSVSAATSLSSRHGADERRDPGRSTGGTASARGETRRLARARRRRRWTARSSACTGHRRPASTWTPRGDGIPLRKSAARTRAPAADPATVRPGPHTRRIRTKRLASRLAQRDGEQRGIRGGRDTNPGPDAGVRAPSPAIAQSSADTRWRSVHWSHVRCVVREAEVVRDGPAQNERLNAAATTTPARQDHRGAGREPPRPGRHARRTTCTTGSRIREGQGASWKIVLSATWPRASAPGRASRVQVAGRRRGSSTRSRRHADRGAPSGTCWRSPRGPPSASWTCPGVSRTGRLPDSLVARPQDPVAQEARGPVGMDIGQPDHEVCVRRRGHHMEHAAHVADHGQVPLERRARCRRGSDPRSDAGRRRRRGC